MYNYAQVTDVPISFESVANGEYAFEIDNDRQITELSYLYFVDANGAPIVPSAGTVTFMISTDGYNWRTADGGAYSAATGFLYPPFYHGRAVAGKIVLSGVTGAAGFRLSLRHHDGATQHLQDMLTSSRRKFRRLRVDVGETGFFEGREFRAFKELNIASGGTYLVRIVVPINIILHSANLTADSGSVRMSTFGGGTPTGVFSESLLSIAKNAMTEVPTPVYVPQVVLTAVPTGGTLSGGALRDVIRLVAGGGQSSTIAAVGSGPDSERGVAPGTYYFLFENIGTGAVTGTFKCHWEERP